MPSEKELFFKHVAQTSKTPLAVNIIRAEGSYMYGPDGENYLDLISGVSVSNVGHCHPSVVEAITIQAAKYAHLMVYGEIVQTPQVQYAKEIGSLLPTGLDQVYFVNSGSEAIEGALKLAKRYTGRKQLISFRNAYHGSTHGALSVMGTEYFKTAYRPLLPETFLIDFNDLSQLKSITNDTAAVLVEPIQGEAGIIMPENDFLKRLRQRCNETGALLIFDEVQTGFGRTGTMFAFEQFGAVPDILALGKAMGGGLPLGAFISSGEIMEKLTHDPPLGHITTFGGNAVCCSAGKASLDIIIGEGLLNGIAKKNSLFRKLLIHKSITEFRGAGLYIGVRLASSDMAKELIKRATEFGLILDTFLFCDDSFRISPPLNISDEDIAVACERIHKALDEIS